MPHNPPPRALTSQAPVHHPLRPMATKAKTREIPPQELGPLKAPILPVQLPWVLAPVQQEQPILLRALQRHPRLHPQPPRLRARRRRLQHLLLLHPRPPHLPPHQPRRPPLHRHRHPLIPLLHHRPPRPLLRRPHLLHLHRHLRRPHLLHPAHFAAFVRTFSANLSAPSTDSGQTPSITDSGTSPLFDGTQSTITSAIGTTVIDGQTSTIFTTIPTTLSPNTASDNASSTKRDIIAGSVGGAALLVLLAAVFLFYRRHQHKKISFFSRLQPKPRTRLLEGEDMDDYDMGPPMGRYHDYPASVGSHTPTHSLSHAGSHNPLAATPTRSPNAPSFNASLLGQPMDPNRTPTPAGRLSPAGGAGVAGPHVLGMRAESGSIFREVVWPPPGQPSTLVDPLVAGSSSVDLTRIVDDVMGPGSAAKGAGTVYGNVPPSAFRGPQGAGASRTALVPDDPFASYSALNTSGNPSVHFHSPEPSQAQPPSAMHSRETSETPLLAPTASPGFFDARGREQDRERERERDRELEPPGSPVPLQGMGPLYVTNMGPLSPASPPPSAQPRNWLERSPKKAVRPSLDREREREAGAVGAREGDGAEVSSAGHGVGEAL
ncbi:hypothetical protein C2E23DRAFT_780702 [Lenzites betulinus]|nr:hypothetical protein C2E23DRAFT_780702 [Lenzites betulinus]